MANVRKSSDRIPGPAPARARQPGRSGPASRRRDAQGALPPGAPTGEGPLGRWLLEECVDHLIPWNRRFLHQRFAFQAAGIGLAVVATASWVLMAAGEISSAVNIAWWTGWSVYEVIVRRHCKPWIKEGVWWGNKRRPATTFDTIAYVATKNLLIGAGLFVLLSWTGLLPAAQ